MIQFICDRCEMEIEVEDGLAGTKYACLNCGDINRVPQGDLAAEPEPQPQDSKPVDRAAKAGYPPDFGPETRVLKVRRCWFRSRIIRFTLALLAAVLGGVGLVWMQLNDRSPWYYALWVPLLIGGLGLIAWWWVDRLSASLEITTKRTIMHRGFFSKSSSEVVHDNIRNIQIEQTFLQRVTRVGRIGISSSGQDGIELQVNHLKDPDELRKIIDLYRPF
ncbi:MAG: PH domain-containing protein [Phycisphaerales bacterium]